MQRQEHILGKLEQRLEDLHIQQQIRKNILRQTNCISSQRSRMIINDIDISKVRLPLTPLDSQNMI